MIAKARTGPARQVETRSRGKAMQAEPISLLYERGRRTEELGEHPTYAPAIMQLPRPRQLHIGLHAAAGDRDRAGWQSHAEHGRQIDLPRYRADLPFKGRRQIRESGVAGPLHIRKIGRQVDHYFETRHYAQPLSAVGAVDSASVVLHAEVERSLPPSLHWFRSMPSCSTRPCDAASSTLLRPGG